VQFVVEREVIDALNLIQLRINEGREMDEGKVRMDHEG
jgi:hypothetical protein